MSNSQTFSTAPAVPAMSPGYGVRPLARRTLRETGHLLLDLPIGVVGFSVMVTALATGASLAITLVGLPLLAGSLLLARYAAGLERARAAALLSEPLSAPPARPRPTSLPAAVLSPLRDTAAWRAASYFLLLLPVGTATFSAAVTWWAGTLFLLTLPLWAWALPHNGPQLGDTTWSSPLEFAASSGAGLLLLTVTPFAIHALAGLDRLLLRLLHTR